MHHHTQFFLFCLYLFFLWYGVCVCVWICVHACVCMYMESRGWHRLSSSIFLHLIFENFELIYTRQVDQQTPGIFPSPPVTRVGVTNTHLQALLLCGCWRSKLGSSHLYSKPSPFQPLSHLPSPQTLQIWTNSLRSNIKQIYKSLLFMREVLVIV